MNSDRLHSAMMCSRQRRTTEINSSSSSKGGCKISVNTHPEAWSWTLLPQSRLKTVLSSFLKKRIHVHNSCCVIIAHVFSHRTRGELTFQFIVRTCQWIFFWYLLKQSTQVVFRQQKLHFVCQINIKEFDDEHEKYYPPRLTRQRGPLPQKSIWHQRRRLRTSTETNQQILHIVRTYRCRTYISPTNSAAGDHWRRCAPLLLQPRDTEAHRTLFKSILRREMQHFTPLRLWSHTPVSLSVVWGKLKWSCRAECLCLTDGSKHSGQK